MGVPRRFVESLCSLRPWGGTCFWPAIGHLFFFFVFACFFVPRLNNNVMGDMEFTGWTGPFAERLARGERPYVDFVLPIPPGSLLLLAVIQKITGRFVLLQELAVIAASGLVLALLSYAIAVRLTTRLNAVLAAAATLVLVVQMPKECAYDHTAQICARLAAGELR